MSNFLVDLTLPETVCVLRYVWTDTEHLSDRANKLIDDGTRLEEDNHQSMIGSDVSNSYHRLIRYINSQPSTDEDTAALTDTATDKSEHEPAHAATQEETVLLQDDASQSADHQEEQPAGGGTLSRSKLDPFQG